MFNLLKNKLSNFIKGLKGKSGKEQEQEPVEKPEAKKQAPKPQEKGEKPAEKPAEKKDVKSKASQIASKADEQEKPKEALKKQDKKPEPKKEEEEPASKPGEKKEEKQAPVKKPEEEHIDLAKIEKKASSEKKGLAPKIGLGAKIKSFFSSEITIGESEVNDLLEELELSLLEADVAYDVSLEVVSQLKKKLVGMKVPKGEVEKLTRQAVQQVLASVMQSSREFDLVEKVKTLPKPAKILFVGPNGAGKTTTMAKLAKIFIDSGLKVVFSASDTFRAAAIEQAQVHADRLGIRLIKSKYGADPASVAFDAINYARSHSIDVVLIDSAGRQDTNANLLDELKKLNRVAKPDLKIYVGESIGGNSVIDQIQAFDAAVGMDGAILTKIDCDAKGGTAISISKATGIPVLFLGVGQAYADLVSFDPEKIAREIMT